MLKVKLFRKFLRLLFWLVWLGKVPKNLQVETLEIPVRGGMIRLRVYKPEGGDEQLPVLVYYHGGGFVVGDIDAYDPITRDLCVRTGHLVFSIDYRLAPEHPFPTAPNDALEALEWVEANCESFGGDPDHMIVCGDSAGGNLSAVVALQARDKFPGLLKGQILIYPCTDYYKNEKPSLVENANNRALSKGMMVWFFEHYLHGNKVLPPGHYEHELLTPLLVDNLFDLPPALVITAEKDPLRDEGIQYGDKMMMNGVEVQNSMYPGEEHGFVGSLGPKEGYNKAMDEIVVWLNQRI